MTVIFKQVYTDGRHGVPGVRDILIEMDDISYAEPTTLHLFNGPLVKVHFRSGNAPVTIKGEPKDLLD